MAKLYFRYGTVNSAKTLNLLAVAHNYRQQGKRPLLVKPALDTRWGQECITARAGLQEKADVICEPSTVITSDQLQGTACILVDEAQFLTKHQVQQLHEMAHLRNLPAICYGLRTDFQGELFPGSATLLALADEMDEMKTICDCGRKATMNMRVDANNRKVTEGAQVEIGGNARYRSVCGRCFRQG